MAKKSKSRRLRLAINGFGRIGRAVFKIALAKKNIEVVAVNDLTDAPTLAHLLQYDSIFGHYDREVSVSRNIMTVAGRKIPVLSQPNPAKLPWKRLRIDVVMECTGRFVKRDAASVHLKAGARKVIISAPVKGESQIPTVLMGVNQKKYNRKDRIISNASCTTNSIAPVAEILQAKFGVAKAMMTTIHSYTADQRLHDAPHKDLRRARAAAHNIVPTSTGAAIATTEAVPELAGLFDGLAIRVPTINVSLSDFTFVLKKNVTVKEVNRALAAASQSPRYKGILGVTDKPLVSSDFIGDTRSSIVDLPLTMVVGGNLVKVVAWYDNEWGYSNRMVELALMIA